MRRSAPRGRQNSNPSEPPVNHCRALVLVDGTAIRQQIKKQYEKAVRDLAASRQELDQYHKTDLPAFTRWFHGCFGAVLTELREWTQRLAADEQLILRVQAEVLFGAGSHGQAYRRVMDFEEEDRQAGPRRETDDEPFEPDAEFEDADGKNGQGFFGGDFGSAGPGGQEEESWFGRETWRTVRQRPAPSPRLKDLYRKLVRYLHPDAQEEMTAQRIEWWHQAQSAYAAGDAEQLEVILTLCEIDAQGTTASTTASLLHRITQQLKTSLRQVKRQLATLRKEPAWKFSNRRDHALMEARLGRQMTMDLEELRGRCQETQELIARWKAGAERLKKPRRRNSRPGDD